VRLRPNLLIGGTLLGAVAAIAATALAWTPYDPTRTNLRRRLRPPGADYLLGTDEFGRDVVSRLMAGAVTSLTVAAATVAVALVLGMAAGLAGGFLRGWTDRILGAVSDTLLAFPGILLALGLLAVLGPSLWGIVLALGLAYAPTVARVVRGAVLSIRGREFVEASRSLGNSEAYTLWRHVLPHTAAPVTVLATSLFGWVILSESALSFLGLGVPPPPRPGATCSRRAGRSCRTRRCCPSRRAYDRGLPPRREPPRRRAARPAGPEGSRVTDVLSVERLSIRAGARHVVQDVSFRVARARPSPSSARADRARVRRRAPSSAPPASGRTAGGSSSGART
jgi:peptide/nickel transport system permease protein